MNHLTALEGYFRERPPMAIAVSGGVDSMTLAVLAHRTRPGIEIFHAVSPAVPAAATKKVETYAKQEDWALHIVDAGEIHDPRYLANPANRCYFCKTGLYGTLAGRTRLRLASGTNLDDLADYRPGLIAAEEHRVCHPYVDIGVDKQGLRKIAAALDLKDLKDLPAAPCLSSRITTGIAIDAKLLPVINEAEILVAETLEGILAVDAIRCRIQQARVAIQLETDQTIDPDAIWHRQIITRVAALFRDRGHASRAAVVTIEPYRKGSAFLVETLEVD